MDLCCLIDSEERLSATDLVTMLGDLLERGMPCAIRLCPHSFNLGTQKPSFMSSHSLMRVYPSSSSPLILLILSHLASLVTSASKIDWL